MKICLLTTNCILFDDRIYYKIGRSLKKIGTIFIINPKVSSIEKNGISIIGNDIKNSMLDSTWIFKNLIKIKPDIIQITEPLLLPIATKYKSKYGARLIYDPAEDWGSMYKDFSRKFTPIPHLLGFGIRQFENWFLSNIDYFITSDDWLFDYYKSRGPCKLIYNYPNRDIFTDPVKENIRDPYKIIYHGQQRKERGLFIMIKAMYLVCKIIPNASLNLIGKFSYDYEKIKAIQLIKELNLEENLSLLSTVPHTDIPKFLYSSQIGLLPFLDITKFHKNIGMKMFEYAACKLPMVVSDLPPARKFIDKEKCGLYVKPGSEKSLAEGILDLLHDSSKINIMAKNGFKAYQNKCYWESQENKLFTIYNELAGLMT